MRAGEIACLMMINRIQNAEDLATFLRVEQEKVNDIVHRASPQVLEIIADTIWSLCMKINIPIEEAEECVRKVKEQDMGYLFENMEKMDIQEERRKTAEARKQLEEAQQRWTEEAQRQSMEAREQIARERRKAISHIVSVYQRVGESKTSAIRALMEAYHMEESAALEEVSRYWKE